jgi:hypothetical protein
VLAFVSLFLVLRPAGVAAISILFFAAAIYLCAVMLLASGAISMMSGAPLMYGLEPAGPYMALLVGCGWALVAWTLFRPQNWARWAAMLVMTLGIAWLVPKISAAEIGWPLRWYGLQIAQIDEAVTKLIGEHAIRPTIVVDLDSTHHRDYQYSPYASSSPTRQHQNRSDSNFRAFSQMKSCHLFPHFIECAMKQLTLLLEEFR